MGTEIIRSVGRFRGARGAPYSHHALNLTPFRRLDDSKHVTKRAALRQEFDGFLQSPDGHLDAKEMIDRMIEIVPSDTGKFRNVVPKAVEDMLKTHQLDAWENQI